MRSAVALVVLSLLGCACASSTQKSTDPTSVEIAEAERLGLHGPRPANGRTLVEAHFRDMSRDSELKMGSRKALDALDVGELHRCWARSAPNEEFWWGWRCVVGPRGVPLGKQGSIPTSVVTAGRARMETRVLMTAKWWYFKNNKCYATRAPAGP